MDRFTRNYSIFLAVVVASLAAWALYEDPLVGELNDLLAQDQRVAAYPYPFRVLRIDDGVAVMGTPRNYGFPAQRALGLIEPRLANRPQNDPDLMRAQQRLAEVQKRALAIVEGSGRVARVRWELDRAWLGERGVLP